MPQQKDVPGVLGREFYEGTPVFGNRASAEYEYESGSDDESGLASKTEGGEISVDEVGDMLQ
jgi:hypothetical protein